MHHSLVQVARRAVRASLRRSSPAACALLCACGSSVSDAGGEAGPGARPAPYAEAASSASGAELLHALEVDGQRLEFERIGRNDVLGEPGSLLLVNTYRDGDRLAALREANGPLTLLETFLAFAPEGAAPAEALLESHASEALALGREDTAEVKRMDGRSLVIDKGSQLCPSIFPFIAPLQYTSQESVSVTLPQTEVFLCAGSPQVFGLGLPENCAQHPTTELLFVAACKSEQRGEDDLFVTFFLNRAPDLGRFIGPGERVDALILPDPDPDTVTRSLAVSASNGPDPQNLAELHSAVGAL